MKQIHKVVMLPTENNSQIGIQANGVMKIGNVGVGTYQHLYILSDEEIKEGDWFIVGKRLVQATLNGGTLGYTSFNKVAFLWIKPHHKKIIATTDKSLSINKNMKLDLTLISIPRIPESFIESYVKADGKIDEVELEHHDNRDYNPSTFPDVRLKLTENNEVIVHSKEEKSEFEKCKESIWYFMTKYAIINGKPFKTLMKEEEFNKWIKENLKQ